MAFNPISRRFHIVTLFILIAVCSLILSFARIEWLNLAFTILVVILLYFFVQLQSIRMTIVPFMDEEFWKTLKESVFYFLIIMIVRLIIYWVSGDVWEKAAMIVLTILIITLYERHSLVSFGLTLRKTGNQIVWIFTGFGFFWVCFTTTNILLPMIVGFRVTGFEFWTNAFTPAMIFLVIKYLLGNFAEEIFFRGFIQTKIKSATNVWIALLIQSTLFALYHFNYLIWYSGSDPLGYVLFYLLFTFLFGLAIGIIFELSGSVLVCTVIHASYNLFFVPNNLLPLAQSGKTLINLPYTNLIALGVFIIIGSIWVLAAKQRRNIE